MPGAVPNSRPARARAARPTRRCGGRTCAGSARLFRPYKLRLGAVLGLIVVSAALGVIPAFLLRGRPRGDRTASRDATRLSFLAGGMIAIAIATGVLGVSRRCSRTRSGSASCTTCAPPSSGTCSGSRSRSSRARAPARCSRGSRTTSAASRTSSRRPRRRSPSNVTTVIATMVGMLLLNWQLALFAFALIPFFVLLTRRVGNERRRIAKTTQETLADISSLVQESLSVSGILLGKTMGRTSELADRFEGDSLRLADLEVRQRMAGRWVMASIQMTFAIMPAAVYWFGGLALAHGSTRSPSRRSSAFTTLQTRLFFPVGSLLGVGARRADVARALRPDLRVPRPAGRHRREARRGRARRRRRRRLRRRLVPATATAVDARGRRASPCPPGTTTAIVGETGSGKTTLGYLAARLYDVGRGSVTIGGVDVRDLTFEALVRPRRRRLAGDLSLPRDGAREPALREAGRDRRGDRGGRARRRASTT